MDKEIYKPIEEKMSKTLNVLKEEFTSVRAGRANSGIIDKVMVDYYGVPTKITQLGNVSVPEARVLMIQPWDLKILKDIEKAIQKSDIGINPNNDGKVIRLLFPELSEERRKELVKNTKKMAEETKIALRSIRRDAIEHFKAQKKNSEITEDDLKDIEEQVQKLTDRFVSDVDKVTEAKEKEIMEV